MAKRFIRGMALLMGLAGAIIAAGAAMDQEPIWGLGVAFLLFLVVLIPVLAVHVKRLDRCEPDKTLLTWRYSYKESKLVAQTILCWRKKQTHWVAPLMGICIAFMGGIFAVVLHEQFPDEPLWQWLLLLLPAALPWVARALYWLRLKDLILRDPCETVVGRDFLIWGNTRPVLNERDTLRAVDADYVTDDDGNAFVHVLYHSTKRLRYGGKAEFRDTVTLLIPMGREEEARTLIGTIRKGADQGTPGDKYVEE